ncbi:DUF3850 domain-containing protein [Lonsdalea quercina]|uniref:DUF3850 domain-containing protein n=1 Tax=Lonsdalea quercina TaxID=71657 RepID=UPI0039760FD6
MTVRIHQMKMSSACFNAVELGKQRAVPVGGELGCEVGDVLSLREWSIDSKYSGRECAAVITHTLIVSDIIPMSGNKIPDYWLMLSIRPLTKAQLVEYVLNGGGE